MSDEPVLLCEGRYSFSRIDPNVEKPTHVALSLSDEARAARREELISIGVRLYRLHATHGGMIGAYTDAEVAADAILKAIGVEL